IRFRRPPLAQKADNRHRLLRTYRERPVKGRTTEKRDELPPLHWDPRSREEVQTTSSQPTSHWLLHCDGPTRTRAAVRHLWTKLTACQVPIVGLLLLHERTCQPRRAAGRSVPRIPGAILAFAITHAAPAPCGRAADKWHDSPASARAG